MKTSLTGDLQTQKLDFRLSQHEYTIEQLQDRLLFKVCLILSSIISVLDCFTKVHVEVVLGLQIGGVQNFRTESALPHVLYRKKH